MKRLLILITILALEMIPVFARQKPDAPLAPNDYSWMSHIRGGHPRMFITADDIPFIRHAAETFENETFRTMKKRADALIGKEIVFTDPLSRTGEGGANRMYGYYASDAAMMWLITEDSKYLDLTKRILGKLTDYYRLRVENNLNIEWYALSQICAMCAWDWIYNDLTPEERVSYGKPLYEVMCRIAWHGPGVRKARFRENVSDFRSGCYGVAVLPWFVGLTFCNEGYDDAYCRDMLKRGYDYLQQMTAFRAEMLGTKGGGASGVPWYCLAWYPYSEYNLIHTFRSAMGIDISQKMEYMVGYLNYIDWIRLPGNKEYGFGDASHFKCNLPTAYLNAHVHELANLFGERHPEILPVAARLAQMYDQRRNWDPIPFMRLMHKRDLLAGVNAAAQPSQASADQPKSMYFDTMGQLYMRSGVGDDDTYALFVSGGIPEQHKHYDNNHFIIYKHGYRALDSGTRPEPGLHLPYYYARTVAHNCVTVKMPGEVLPKYWGELAAGETALPVPNDGGQNNQLACTLKYHKETADYVYLASDATKSYNSSKTSNVMREFVYIFPDLFVVLDRVNASKAEYQKTWLYHTVDEPQIEGLTFTETSQGGRTICRTLYPADAVIEKIGGPGKQFWSDGRNWPLPAQLPSNCPPEDWPLLGQWRVEVKPAAAQEDDIFLHVIQVGDTSLKALPETVLDETDASVSVSFSYAGKDFQLSFDKKSSYGCNIQVKK